MRSLIGQLSCDEDRSVRFSAQFTVTRAHVVERQTVWGYNSKVDSLVATMHVDLSNELSDLVWTKSQIWNSRVSVHEWSINDVVYAFDVSIETNRVELSIVVRDASKIDDMIRSLKAESIDFASAAGRPGRVTLHQANSQEDRHDSVEMLTKTIRSSRRAIELNSATVSSFTDEATGFKVTYTVKDQRKSNDQLIFLFTSIRKKKHWVDFDGALGKSLATNRSRIVFINDDASNEYNYHLAIEGDTAIYWATVRFITDYVEKHNYDWSNVVLAGMSKGGTAALALGSALPGCSVIALAPQLSLGDYLLRSKREGIIKQITGNSSLEGARMANELLWTLMERQVEAYGIRRCVILTSENDVDCLSGLQRFQKLLNDAKREVDLVIDESEFTSTHLNTVHHLMPLFVSILGLYSAGIRPKISV